MCLSSGTNKAPGYYLLTAQLFESRSSHFYQGPLFHVQIKVLRYYCVSVCVCVCVCACARAGVYIYRVFYTFSTKRLNFIKTVKNVLEAQLQKCRKVKLNSLHIRMTHAEVNVYLHALHFVISYYQQYQWCDSTKFDRVCMCYLKLSVVNRLKKSLAT